MEFLNTVDKYGNKRWYVDGKRVTKSTYQQKVKLCVRVECLQTKIVNGVIRQTATGVLK